MSIISDDEGRSRVKILCYTNLSMASQSLRPNISRVIYNAVLFDPKNRQVTSLNAGSLQESVKRLFTLLKARQVDFLLVGGIAVLSYVEGRNTGDLELIIAVPALKKLPEIKLSNQEQFFGRGSFEELKIDLLLTTNPLFAKVMQQYATPRPFLEMEVPTATVDGLILLKLYALTSLYCQGNFGRVSLYENDIAVLVFQYDPDLAAIVRELAEYVTGGDMDDLRQHILAEIQQRIAHFKKKFSSLNHTGEQ
jgi:hypothetical protein